MGEVQTFSTNCINHVIMTDFLEEFATTKFSTVNNLHTVHGKYLEGENIGEFGKSWQFAKFLLTESLSFTIQIACKSKFTNILPSKS